MALHLKLSKAQRQALYYQRWYRGNRVRLSIKRAARYRDDPAYREAAIERSRAQRQK